MLLFAVIERLDYEHWEAIIVRYQLDTDGEREPDAAALNSEKGQRVPPTRSSSVC